MDTTREEDLIIVTALVRFSVEYGVADAELAEQVWEMANKLAAEHDLSPENAALELDIGW